jgi:hypothetical protein
LKHNYDPCKDNLKELIRIGLVRKFDNGMRSGKNKCKLYIKHLPESLSSEDIDKFSSKYLNPINISWSEYLKSCQKLILSSKSAVLSPETSCILNNDVYKRFVFYSSNEFSLKFVFFLSFLKYSSTTPNNNNSNTNNHNKIDKNSLQKIKK